MKIDISRDSFDPRQAFTRVLLQQGRLMLDADFNEQSAMFQRVLRNLVVDLLGPTWGPKPDGGAGTGGFGISRGDAGAILIGSGRYYVGGIPCEAGKDSDGKPWTFVRQPYAKNEKLTDPSLIYLHVWERAVTAANYASIADPGLDPLDTAGRAEAVWQVRGVALAAAPSPADAPNKLNELVGDPDRDELPKLMADVKADALDAAADPSCSVGAGSAYRGVENQLYRVEAHQVVEAEKAVLVKWSRDNGAVVFPVREIGKARGGTARMKVAHLGADDRFKLCEGHWVEFEDDAALGDPFDKDAPPLYQVATVDRIGGWVTLKVFDDEKRVAEAETQKPPRAVLRRWDTKPAPVQGRRKQGEFHGVVKVPLNPPNVAAHKREWMPLEAGIRVSLSGAANTIRRGDYWLIPARANTGGILDEAAFTAGVPARSIVQYLAPLAWLNPGTNDAPQELRNLA